ncbi:SdpI family protein [Patescibacteria group bacterium]|nr:SdpI family protein [Patescibacteria group bacterium]
MKYATAITLLIILATFVLGVTLYPHLPAHLATHWNMQGNVNHFTPKFWSVFGLPFIMIGIAVLFLLIPLIDPLKKNITAFRPYFDLFVVLLMLFLFYTYLLVIIWNMGNHFNMNEALVPALGAFFYYLGVLMAHAQPNWFVGIRTPWTLSNTTVWRDTHRLGGRLYKITGLIAVLGFFVPQYALWVAVIPLLIVSLFLIIYSYVDFQSINRRT